MPRGGKRENAGRPKGKPTKTISFRVPEERVKQLYTKIKTIIHEELSTNRS
jgi:hypothetical protein